MSHTPGPWKHNPAGTGTVIAGPDGLDVCYLLKTKRVRGNTVLIAAAPELLEALEEVFEYLNDLMPPNDPRNLNNAKDIAKNAIAKAKGGK